MCIRDSGVGAQSCELSRCPAFCLLPFGKLSEGRALLVEQSPHGGGGLSLRQIPPRRLDLRAIKGADCLLLGLEQ